MFLFGFRLQDLHTILYFFSGFGSKTFDRFRLKSKKTLHHHHQSQNQQYHFWRNILLPHWSQMFRGTVRDSTSSLSLQRGQFGHTMMVRVVGAVFLSVCLSVCFSVRIRNQQNNRRCLDKKKDNNQI